MLPVRQVQHDQSDPPGIRRKGLRRKKDATSLPGARRGFLHPIKKVSCAECAGGDRCSGPAWCHRGEVDFGIQ